MPHMTMLMASALTLLVMSCNPAAETAGMPRRGSTVAENATPGDIVLSWTGGDATVKSYDVFFGKSLTDSFTKLQALTAFDKATPAIALIKSDLDLVEGDTACFYVVAYNSLGASLPSEKICGTVPD